MLSLPGFLVAAAIGAGAFLVGVGLTLLAVGSRRPLPDPGAQEDTGAEELSGNPRQAASLALLARALREPLRRMREGASGSELLPPIERVAWQARMLASRRRPLQAQPCSPIALLQEAAQQVEALRLGKVVVSWSLLTRQPVQLDLVRARGAFRELLQAAADAAGEGHRVSIRVHEGSRARYPVGVEIEVGRRGVEPDSLACRVARHLLESQGAEFTLDGALARVNLPSLTPADA